VVHETGSCALFQEPHQLLDEALVAATFPSIVAHVPMRGDAEFWACRGGDCERQINSVLHRKRPFFSARSVAVGINLGYVLSLGRIKLFKQK
jgi:hypothetical protein